MGNVDCRRAVDPRLRNQDSPCQGAGPLRGFAGPGTKL